MNYLNHSVYKPVPYFCPGFPAFMAACNCSKKLTQYFLCYTSCLLIQLSHPCHIFSFCLGLKSLKHGGVFEHIRNNNKSYLGSSQVNLVN